MLYFALAFLGGDACILYLKQPPSLLAPGLLLFICLGCFFTAPELLKKYFLLIIAFLLGLSWATFSAQAFLKEKIPPELLNRPIIITGVIDSIPEYKNQQASIIFKLEQIRHTNSMFNHAIRVRVNWYFPPYTLRVGERWQLQVRLKNPYQQVGAGNFAYQAWLFEQRIVATGYVQDSINNRLIAKQYYAKIIDHYRENIASHIQQILHNQPAVGLIQALAVGERSHITEDQWNTLRGTGTNHLFAIAGLHIGFVSGFSYLLVSFLWRRAGRLSLYIATPIAAVWAALCSAILYSALAGFSLPTQRAIIMTIVFLLANLLRRKIPGWHSWSIALILVLVYDPFAVLSVSFWMSFSAVALIIYGVSGRLYTKNRWRDLLYPQWVISIGLIPLCLLFFQQYSLAGFIANVIAIPWIGFLVLPLSLLGGIISILNLELARLFLMAGECLLEFIWPLLTAITQLSNLQWHINNLESWTFISACVAVILVLMPRGIPGRWLSIVWAIPICTGQLSRPSPNEIWLTVLKINAGVAVIVRTAAHVVVYESGLKANSNATIVLPYLQQAGIKHIDVLVSNAVTPLTMKIVSRYWI